MNVETLIRQVLYTLDQIDVKGRENIDRMLGCMQALEKIANAMKHNREGMEKIPEMVKKTTQEGGEKNG
jgi:hypothetical protein